MRIITGAARGRRLWTLPGGDTRPTAARVKEGLFSAIQFETEGRRVLDLFAGSGQLGLEALSRGADSCVFVDESRDAVDIIRRNLRHTGLPEAKCQIVQADALTFLKAPRDRFDLAFLDPPYASHLLEPALRALVPHMNPGGVILCESDGAAALPDTVGEFTLHKQYRYGVTFVWLYRTASLKT